MPACPHKIAVLINGEVNYIQLYGDENNKWAETEDGYTIIQNDKQQWCYARLNEDSTLVASQWLLGSNKTYQAEFNRFITSTQKHLTGNHQNRKSISNAVQRKKPAIGQRKVLIILMSYKDLNFSKKKNDFERLFNEEGYDDDNAQGSVRDFYLSASYNQLQLESDVYGPYQTSHEMAYYGRNNGMQNGQDVNAYSLFVEAISYVEKEADLKEYDGDDDGYIDNVHIIFAGHGEEAGANSNAIWSHEATFNRPYEIQGLKIDRYSCAPELRGNVGNGISRIGPHCHEIGHALGAMDYYDTNYATGGQYVGTGEWDIMAEGSWNNEGITPADFNPYVKAYNYGWIEPKILPKGKVTLRPSCDDMDSYYILKTSEYSDYYMIENRSTDSWGAGVPGKGLLIYHIHSDIMNAGNTINTSAPQMCYIVCASSKYSQPGNSPNTYGDINSDGCPYPGTSPNTNFGQNSLPKAFFWDETVCNIEINNISMTNNGNIELTNNSKGSDYKPTDMTTVFFEGFEDETKLAINRKNGSAWVIEDNPENTMTIIDRPTAFEGTKSLQLSALNSKQDIMETFEFSCPFTTNKGRKRITISIASSNIRFNLPNYADISYHTTDNPDWQHVIIYSSDNNRWRTSYIDLPSNADPHITVTGNVYAGSVLAIDNIEVEQEILDEETSIENIDKMHNTVGTIFTINGIQLQEAQKGINIIRTKDGQTYKVFIK